MADAKVRIDVEVSGADNAQQELKDVAATENAATEATKTNTNAVKENSSAQSEASTARSAQTSATQKNTNAIDANTVALDKNAETSKDSGGWLDKLAEKFEGQEHAVRGAQRMNESFAALMKGNFVGAVKMAIAAVWDFTAAIIANPVGALVTVIIALGAAVAGLAAAWSSANEELENYMRNHHKIEELQRNAENIASGGNRLASVSDEELEKMRADAKQRDDEARAKVGYNIQQQKRWDESVQRHGTVANASWGGRRLVRAERWKERTESAIEVQKETGAALAEVEAELDRRAADKAKEREARLKRSFDEQQREAKAATIAAEERIRAEIEHDKRVKALAEKQAALADEQRYAEIEENAERQEKGSGILAGLKARKEDVENQIGGLDYSLADEEKRVELKKQLFKLEQLISAEEKRQTETAEKNAQDERDALANRRDAMDEWARGRELSKMEAEERVKALQKEIDFRREIQKMGAGSAYNDAKLREAIDARDRAQEEVNKKQEQRREEVKKQRESRLDSAADLYNNTQDFLHRNDTAVQKLNANSKNLREAVKNGDTQHALELMMEGESLADEYDQPMTKSEQRRAERKAERDAKEAKNAAKAYKEQVAKVERGLRQGDKSAAEVVAEMNQRAGGVASYQVKDGKIVKVAGQDEANRLLHDILEALS